MRRKGASSKKSHCVFRMLKKWEKEEEEKMEDASENIFSGLFFFSFPFLSLGKSSGCLPVKTLRHWSNGSLKKKKKKKPKIIFWLIKIIFSPLCPSYTIYPWTQMRGDKWLGPNIFSISIFPDVLPRPMAICYLISSYLSICKGLMYGVVRVWWFEDHVADQWDFLYIPRFKNNSGKIHLLLHDN